LLFVGKIIRVRGNKGEVIYVSSTTAKYRPNPGDILILKSEKYQKKLVVEKYREIKGNKTVKFTAIGSISEALKLVGYSIFNPHDSNMDDRSTPLENYIVKDKNGQLWGKVIGLTAYKTNEILEVEDADQEEVYYIPYTEEIVKDINEENLVITIDPPDGLKSLNKK
jgi:16S rRNA processing protein RimM